MTTPDANQSQRRRNRWMLIAIVAVFVVPFVGGGLLRLAGIHPPITRQKGELLEPKGDLRQIVPMLADGRAYRWRDFPRTWRIAVVARGCDGTQARACATLLGQLDTVWQLTGRDADRVHVLWIGALPPGGPRPAALKQLRASDDLRRGLPRSDDPAGSVVYLLDPNGFVVLRYAPGFDPGGLRTDLSRLLKIN